MDAGFQIPYPVENNFLCMFEWIAVPLFLYCMLCMWLCAGRNQCWLPAVLWSVCWVLGCTEAWWSCVISLQDSRKSVVKWKLFHAATNLIYEHYYLAQNTSASFLRQKYGVTTYVENIEKKLEDSKSIRELRNIEGKRYVKGNQWQFHSAVVAGATEMEISSTQWLGKDFYFTAVDEFCIIFSELTLYVIIQCVKILAQSLQRLNAEPA